MRDLRYALRSLSKSPGFVLVATLCLGLALALNTTTFAILDAMLHPSLPVKDVERLLEVRMLGGRQRNDVPAWVRYQILRTGQFYEDIAFYEWEWGEVVAGTEVGEQAVARVSSTFFGLLGVEPERGRLLGPGAPENSAVVSHTFWERTLGGRPLEGLTFWVNGLEYRVIGVVSTQMGYPGPGVWIALPPAAEQTGVGMRWFTPVVKLRRGVSQERVKADLATLAGRLRLEYGAAITPYTFDVRSIAPSPAALRQIHFAMMGAAFLVLLIACANLASLMLVRGAAKRREIALRLALGAGRRGVVQQLLAEGTLVATAGATVGLLLTLWAIPVLNGLMPPNVPTLGIVPPQASWRVFAAGLLAALGTVVIFALGPAVRASDVHVSEPLKEGATATSGGGHRRYSPVVVLEVALSLVLLMGAALLTKSAGRLSMSTLGFDRKGLLESWVWLGRREADQVDSIRKLSHDLLARIAALPAVRSVGAQASRGGTAAVMSEFYDGSSGFLPRTSLHYVNHGFLRTLGIPVIEGRDFAPGDEDARVAIVDQTVAAALWPDRRALGQLIRFRTVRGEGAPYRVVGVARAAFAAGPWPEPYVPSQGAVYVAWQPGPTARGWQLAIRTTKLDAAAAVALRQTIRDALPGGGAVWLEPWLFDFDTEMRARYFLVRVFSAFSVFALALAAIGLYGVVSYSVSQRMREFAVRIAVGAPSKNVIKLVAHDGAVMILAGTGIGAFLAMWGSTLLGDWLYTVHHTDAVSLVVAEAVLFLAGLAACLQPALRAMRANPVEILRAI